MFLFLNFGIFCNFKLLCWQYDKNVINFNLKIQKNCYKITYIIYFFYFLRILAYGYILSYNSENGTLTQLCFKKANWDRLVKYDFWFSFIDQNSFIAKPILFALLSGQPLFAIASHYFTFYRPNALLTERIYDLIILNKAQLEQIKKVNSLTKQRTFDSYFSLPIINLKSFNFDFLYTGRVLWENAVALYSGNIEIPASKQHLLKLTVYQNVPFVIRTRVILFVIVTEYVLKLINLCFCK